MARKPTAMVAIQPLRPGRKRDVNIATQLAFSAEEYTAKSREARDARTDHARTLVAIGDAIGLPVDDKFRAPEEIQQIITKALAQQYELGKQADGRVDAGVHSATAESLRLALKANDELLQRQRIAPEPSLVDLHGEDQPEEVPDHPTHERWRKVFDSIEKLKAENASLLATIVSMFEAAGYEVEDEIDELYPTPADAIAAAMVCAGEMALELADE